MGNETHERLRTAAAQGLILPELLFTPDLVRVLRASSSTIRVLLRSGRIPATKLGKRWIVRRDALLRSLTADGVHLRLVAPGGGNGGAQ